MTFGSFFYHHTEQVMCEREPKRPQKPTLSLNTTKNLQKKNEENFALEKTEAPGKTWNNMSVITSARITIYALFHLSLE